MNYADGQQIRLNDRVELWEGNQGTVVCSLDTWEFSEAYPEAEWVYLNVGILIASEQAGLLHFTEPENSLRLVSRG